MTQPVQADGVGLLVSRESTPGTQPTTGWGRVQVNPGGLQSGTRANIIVERHILSPNLTPERGEVVGYDVAPKLALDVNKDMLDWSRELTFRRTTIQNGGTGTCKFAVTAVTAGSPASWTVAAGGGLQSGIVVRGKNFANAANNGLHVLTSGSTATSVKTSDTLVTEASPPANAVLEVVGFQGASADIAIDANGNITSTIADFTTMGLVPEQQIVIGDLTSGAAFAFATTTYNSDAVIKTVAAHLITLKFRNWTVGSADTGTGKTIRLLFHSAIQNVPLDPTGANGYLPAPTASFEVSELGSAGATDYTYWNGCAVKKWTIDIPVEGKMTATLDMIGMIMSNPTSSRSSGPSTAVEATSPAIYTTGANMTDIRLLKQSDESRLSAEINSMKIDYDNNTKPRKQLGTAGAAGLIFGEYTPVLSFNAYVLDNNLTNAINGNTDAVAITLNKNSDGGVGFYFPMVKPRKGDKTYAAGDSVKIACDVPANRDPGTGVLWTMTQFAYLP
jgi:hypothetical protein